jgi:hypothetical protein
VSRQPIESGNVDRAGHEASGSVEVDIPIGQGLWMSTPDWENKGCAVCRIGWETGDPPPEVAVNVARHARLHECSACGQLWEQNERFPDVLDRRDATRFYPAYDEPPT